MTELAVYVKDDMVSLSADIVSMSIAHKIALKRSEKEVFTEKIIFAGLSLFTVALQHRQANVFLFII